MEIDPALTRLLHRRACRAAAPPPSGRASATPTGARAARRAAHQAGRPLGAGRATGCCAAMPPRPRMWRAPDGRRARRPDGHRSALSGRLRRRQPPARPGANGGKPSSPEPRPSTGTTYIDQAPSVQFYERLPAVRAQHGALSRRSGDLHVLRHDARAALSLPPGSRPACCPPGRSSGTRRRIVLTRSRLHVGLRAAALRLDQGPPAASRAAPAGQRRRGLGDLLDDRRRPERPHPTRSRSSSSAGRSSTTPGVGEVIYEPFCGIGTALIAAEMTGRRCSPSSSPRPSAMRRARWERFTGRQAICDGPGH